MSAHRGDGGRPSPAGGALRGLRFATVALVATVALGAVPASSGAKPIFGVVPQDGGVPPGSDLDLMPQAGISSMRLLFHWASIETSQGQYDWSTIDEVVRETTSHGITPFPFVSGMPVWAAHADGRSCTSSECWDFAPKSTATRKAYADFMTVLVKRYGPGGVFWTEPTGTSAVTNGTTDAYAEDGAVDTELCGVLVLPDCAETPEESPATPSDPATELDPTLPACQCTAGEEQPIRTWQIWNEQNSPKYYAPKANVRKYAALVREAGGAVHAADPGAEVILGGMWGPDSAKKVVMPVKKFLAQLYRVKRIKKSFDSIAIHPYSSAAKASLAQLRQARTSMLKEGHDKGAGMWVTEVGWATDGPKREPYVKSLKGQARTLSQALSSYKRNARRLNLQGVLWYSWRDRPNGELICTWCGHAGLRTLDGDAKPAFGAFAKVAKK